MSDFVNFKIAQKLKEKGFSEECLYHYPCSGGDYAYANCCPGDDVNTDYLYQCNNKDSDRLIDAPTISQVLKWLREKGVDIYCTPNWHNKTDKYYVVCIVRDRIYNYGAYIDDNDFSTYEKAALAGIEYVLDNFI